MARPRNDLVRQRVVQIARQLFGARGFAATSLERVARRAGVTKGAVYLHFASKEHLFFAVLDEVRAELRAVPAAAPEAAPRASAASALQDLLAGLIRFHLAHPEVHAIQRAAATELRGGFTSQLRGDLGADRRALRARLQELLVEGQRDGSLPVDDPAYTAFVLACSLEGLLEVATLEPRDLLPFGGAESMAARMVAPLQAAARPRAARRAEPGLAGTDALPTLAPE